MKRTETPKEYQQSYVVSGGKLSDVSPGNPHPKVMRVWVDEEEEFWGLPFRREYWADSNGVVYWAYEFPVSKVKLFLDPVSFVWFLGDADNAGELDLNEEGIFLNWLNKKVMARGGK